MTTRVESWYDENVDFEDDRLVEGRLEYEVTMHTILQLLDDVKTKAVPEAEKLSIIDCACGTGRYAIELAKRGHDVTISDLSSGLLKRAQSNAAARQVTFKQSLHCDARYVRGKLDPLDQLFDVSLALGPMYHVLDRAERVRLLVDLLSITKPHGFVAVAFVSRNAHLRDVCTRDPARLHREEAFYRKYLQDGVYDRGSGPSMYHASLDEINALIGEVAQVALPFKLRTIVACEGFLGFRNASHLAKLSDAEFESWLDAILASCEEQSNLGTSDHLLVVLERTGS